MAQRDEEGLGPYGRLAQWVLGHRLAVGISTIVIAVVAVLIGFPPKVDSNILSLLPASDPIVKSTLALHEEEGGANLITMVFRVRDENADKPTLEAFHDDLDALAVQLQALPDVSYAVHRVDPELAFRLGLLQLNASDVEALTTRLQGAVMMGSALNPMLAQQLLDMGPLTQRVQQARESSLLQETDRRGTVLARPTGSSHDPAFCKQVMEEVDRVIEASGLEAKGVDLAWLGGAYRHTNEDFHGLRADLAWTSIASILLVLATITIAFRSWKAAILVFVPLLIGNAVNLALVAVWIGHLNTYTSMALAMLIGLGIDFAIHLVGRYRELMAQGLTHEEAIPRAWDLSGPPCTTAALTSAAGFLALAAGNFLGFSQLGVVLAVGLMLCLGSMLVILPVLLPILDAAPRTLLGTGASAPDSSTSTYRLAPIFLMVAVIVTALLGGTRIPNLQFNYDLSAMRRAGQAYEELTPLERELAEKSYSPVIISFDDRDTLATEHHRIQKMIDEERIGYFARVISIENVLPEDQQARVTALGKLAEIVRKPDFRKLGLTAAQPIAIALMPMADYVPRLLTRDDLPSSLLDLLGAGHEDRFRMILIPKGNMWDLREAEKMKDEVLALEPGHAVAGELPASGALYTLVRGDIPIVATLAVVLVVMLTMIDLKRPLLIGGALFTLAAGLIWSFSALQVLGVEITIVNMVGVPILLGIGIDVVIHLVHRLTEEGPGGVRRALSTTGVAASLSALTTVMSFLSLVLAGTRGIRGLGILVVVGLTAVFLASAILLPLTWAAGWRVTGQAPGDERD